MVVGQTTKKTENLNRLKIDFLDSANIYNLKKYG